MPSDRAGADDAAPAGTLEDLLGILDLRADPASGPDSFIGQSQPQPWGRVYGGQVLAQALVAAQRTVDPDGERRPVHSMHAYFLRAGDDTEPITFCVERLRDGQSFSARRVLALQFGRAILTLAASFQMPGEGLEHAEPAPDDVPPPESLLPLAQRYAHLTSEGARRWLRQRPVELRHVTPPPYVEPSPDRVARQQLWMRTTGPLPAAVDTPAMHAAVLAYASDYSQLEPVLRRHGVMFALPGLRVASLDHAMWFHRPARADEWLLVDVTSPSAQGARALGTSRFHTRDGVLVASAAQEGMLRLTSSADRR
ncbi:MAG: acyl-CoA thioesterase II [Kineosporiaceae bacterium]|nr:acyl-CoA thioesterase II [Kineosporiaceae bacterium]